MKVIIATPTYDGKIDYKHVHCLLQTLSLCASKEIQVFPIHIAGDAIIQKVRNEFLSMLIESKDVDCLVFIDDDIRWNPEDFLKLIEHPKKIVGGTVTKRNDKEIKFNVRMKHNQKKLKIKDGLCEVEAVGTGFLKIHRSVIEKMWKKEPSYKNNMKEYRMIFDLGINGKGELLSEDINFCVKAKKYGFKTYIDPTISCEHVGAKDYFVPFMESVKQQGLIE